jgi:polyisoprenoid-binding protein YceI
MKKISFLLGLFLIGLFVFSNFSIDASNTTITERFNVDTKKDVGATGAYNFDKAHSFIGFTVKHMGLIEVPGYFRDFTGTINYNAEDVKKSSVEFTAKATSVDTGVAPRDKHLRTADFFDVEKYADVTFKSTKIEKKGKGWMMTGDFTMRGVTKEISFPFEIAGFLPGEKATRMGATAQTTINRRDFGVNYGSNLPNGTAVLSDEVKINLQIEANMPNPAATTTKTE